jgi:hypothetical protein
MAREMADKEHNLLDKLVPSALSADSIGGHGFRNEQDLTDAEGPSARLGGARRDLPRPPDRQTALTHSIRFP